MEAMDDKHWEGFQTAAKQEGSEHVMRDGVGWVCREGWPQRKGLKSPGIAYNHLREVFLETGGPVFLSLFQHHRSHFCHVSGLDYGMLCQMICLWFSFFLYFFF